MTCVDMSFEYLYSRAVELRNFGWQITSELKAFVNLCDQITPLQS